MSFPLTRMICQGYKAFEQRAEVEIRGLTVLFGANNSGKTALVRLPMVASAGLAAPIGRSSEAGGAGADFSQLQDMANAAQAHPSMYYKLEWGGGSFGVEYQAVVAGDVSSVQVVRVDIDGKQYPLDIAIDGGSRGTLAALRALDSSIGGRGLQHRENLSSLNERIVHIASERASLGDAYALRDPRGLGIEEAPYHLADDPELLANVSAWMDEALGPTQLDVDRAAFAFRLTTGPASGLVNAARAGRGTQAVVGLATVLHALALGRRRDTLLIVEEPEAHLHPSAHGALADLLIAAIRTGNQVMVETHSENLILRLRRRIAETTLSPEALSLNYVASGATVAAVPIDETGSTDEWPTGVFEADIAEAEAIVEARLSALEGGALS